MARWSSAALATMLFACLAAPAALAAPPFTLVVPFAAGGSSDQLARRIAQAVQEILGEPEPAVLNVPGHLAAYDRFLSLASGPDAATSGPALLMADLDTALALRESSGVDITTALAPVALLGHRPVAIYAAAGAARAGSGVRPCADRACTILATPSPVSQRCAMNLARQLGVAPSQVVSYRGAAAAVADIGVVPGGLLCMTSLPGVLARETHGLWLVAWGSPTAFALPDGPVPVLAELGMAPVAPSFAGLFAGPGLAPDTMDRLAAAVHAVLADPGFRTWAASRGLLDPAASLLVAEE